MTRVELKMSPIWRMPLNLTFLSLPIFAICLFGVDHLEIAIPIILLISVVSVRNLRYVNGVLLTIDHNGIEYFDRLLSKKPISIPWSDIKRIESDHGFWRSVTIVLYDPVGFRSTLLPLVSFHWSVRPLSSKGGFRIPLYQLEFPASQIEDIMILAHKNYSTDA
jgi:hypothetical protein